MWVVGVKGGEEGLLYFEPLPVSGGPRFIESWNCQQYSFGDPHPKPYRGLGRKARGSTLVKGQAKNQIVAWTALRQGEGD